MNANKAATAFSKGLQWRRFDLHVHTPASTDYRGASSDSAADIVDAAIKKTLAGIAITDHQTGEFIDRVKDAAKHKGLVVFPAVELLVTGGEGGVHVLVLFDVDKDSRHIDQFLNKLGIYDKHGEKTIAAEMTVGQVADELDKYDPSAVLILPHCHSSKGVLGDIKGETRTVIFEERRTCILGAEASETDFTNEEKRAKHKRVVDVLDGKDPNFHNRRLGVYSSSDAHALEEIGSSFTYFKVDEPITIEDLRQCLIDRDTRIRQSFEFQAEVYPHIDELAIDSGFLADQTLSFHEGLNSILGAKGAGKSLAIEFLRFALNQPPASEDMLADHESKIETCLKLHGTVQVVLTDESARQYRVTRIYNPAESNPTEITDLSDNTRKEFAIDQLFPVLFLSQGEIARIAEDKTGASQRQFIDTFFDFHKFRAQIESLTKELADLDERFSEVLKAHLASADLKKKIATYKEEIQKLERQIQNPAFAEYSRKENVGRAIHNQLEFLDTLRVSLIDTKNEYSDLITPSTGDPNIDGDPAVKRAKGQADSVGTKIKDAVDKAISFLDDARKEVVREHTSWEALFKPTKDAYDAAVTASGGTQPNLDQKRKLFVTELAKVETSLAKVQGKANVAESIGKRRNETIDRLDAAYKEYFEQRKKRCEFFTAQSMGTLIVTIKEREDTSGFRANLLNLKKGSWLKDEDVEKISQSVSPREFVNSLLRYEWSYREKKDLLQGVAAATGMKAETVQKLAEHLLDTYDYGDILALLYTSVPEDVPSISYKVGNTFKDLSQLSVGQKAVALLIIALSDGTFPIIIDQPEDSLDLRTIWDDLCHKLRTSKDRRQFIFTTHNSSVAVASDSDKFTILQATADQGKVIYSGSINRHDLKEEVINYLEGGKRTYDHKRRKYNL